ncbi:MAG: hypothetical protein A4S16_09915 [Proteobacteria bacterium SG_bin6]|nr:MAG: hypothetical protein A4S16_09915 [Proteobacteria bacterium SG_bin6]
MANGLRYAILPRPAKEPGIALLMRVEGGFIAERRPGERGLAHLIEHLVFDSPTRRAPGERAHFVKVGLPLTFPAPRAATTDWRESRYFVSTRSRRVADIDRLLALFQEGVQDLTFRADAVDAQRADVMREMAEKRAGNITYARYIAAVAPGTPTDVIDAQNSDDVPSASIATIRALYRRLYRPEHVTIVIVGDVNPKQIAALIRRHFGDWRGTGPATKPWPIPPLRPARIARLSFAADAAGRRGAIVTVAPAAPAPAPNAPEQIERHLTDQLVTRIVTRRLARLQGERPIGQSGMFIETGAHGQTGGRRLALWDNFEPGQWRMATARLVQTVCTLSGSGFASAEIAAAKTALIEELARADANAPAEENVAIAQRLADAVANGALLPAPDALLRHARVWLPMVDKPMLDRWWEAQWRSGLPHVRVETPEFQEIASPATAIGEVIKDSGAPGCPLTPDPAASRDR